MPRISKKFALLLVLAMLATMFVGMGTASATTTNTPLSIPNLTVGTQQVAGTIQIAESTPGSFQTAFDLYGSIQLVVTLPAGSAYGNTTGYFPVNTDIANYVDIPRYVGTDENILWNAAEFTNVSINPASTNTTLVLDINDTTLNSTNGTRCFINLLFNNPGTTIAGITTGRSQLTVQAAAADWSVNLLETTGAITSGSVTNAKMVVGGTSAYALSTPTVTQGSDRKLGIIRLVENMPGALDVDDESIWITLPRGFEIADVDTMCIGGFVSTSSIDADWASYDVSGNAKLWFDVNSPSVTTAGICDISLWVDISPDAAKGDIVATIGGNNSGLTPTTVVIGKYGEYGITAECADPTNIYAGRVQAKIGVPVLKENVPATLVAGRTVNLTLPAGSVWVDIPQPVVTRGFLRFDNDVQLLDNGRTVSYTVYSNTSGVTSWAEFRQGTVAVALDTKPGDLILTFGGTAGAESDKGEKVSVKVATIVAPIVLKGETPKPTIIIGKQGQSGTNFTVTEAGVGALMADLYGAYDVDDILDYVVSNVVLNNNDGWYSHYYPQMTSLLIQAPAGVVFTSVPEISVTGDLLLATSGIKLTPDKTTLIIPIDKSSVTTASTINFKNVKFTVDRTVAEGDVELSALGSAVDAYTIFESNNIIDDNDFYVIASKDVVGTISTPALGTENKTAVFVIGQSKFTLEGVEISMEVAPYVKDGRTFLPLAYVAQGLGLLPSNIIWDEAARTVTLIKGDKVLQVKIGSNQILVNGATMTIDAAAEITNSRTCLPVALIAQALGETVTWDAATQTITIQ